MSHELTNMEKQLLDGELARLGERAKLAHERVGGSLRRAVAHALLAGRALLAARKICPKGRFSAWLESHFGPASTARGYMRLVSNWDIVKGDLQRAGGLSQRELSRLLKGRPCSDGQANPRSGAAPRLPAPAPAEAPVSPAADAIQPAPTATAKDDVFHPLERLLNEVVAELERLSAPDLGWSDYAQHILQPIDRIRRGLARRSWVWDMIPNRDRR